MTASIIPFPTQAAGPTQGAEALTRIDGDMERVAYLPVTDANGETRLATECFLTVSFHTPDGGNLAQAFKVELDFTYDLGNAPTSVSLQEAIDLALDPDLLNVDARWKNKNER